MPILSLISRRRAALAGVLAACAAAGLSGAAGAPRASGHAVAAGHTVAAAARPDYVPGKVVVGFRFAPTAAVEAEIAARSGAALESLAEPDVALVDVRRGETVRAAIARLRAQPGVAYAVPDYVAHTSGYWFPNDRGRSRARLGWRALQWNFLAQDGGVGAPVAWSNLRTDLAPGGRGVTVAILDTGVAYRNWRDPRTHEFFARSPDFAATRFTAPCDLIRGTIRPVARPVGASSHCTAPVAVDRNGHGTFVAGVVGESTNNHVGVTGLAYGATIMPVRVLDADGNGDSVTIARGIRWAATHGARVINLSLEFDLSVTADQIPDVVNAIHFAHQRGILVVAAAGNDTALQLAYPAADPETVSVGATTRDRCLAAYSDTGAGLDLVAPGGGDDASVPGDPNCHPDRLLPDVFQMTLLYPSDSTDFGLPNGWYGTSMAAPHVAAAAALIIASGVLGARPTAGQVLTRLESTATPLGPAPHPNQTYGYGLLNAAAATSGVSRTLRSRQHRHRPHG
jgi:serine protease